MQKSINMLFKIEARILIFPGTDFHFLTTFGAFFRLCGTHVDLYMLHCYGPLYHVQICHLYMLNVLRSHGHHSLRFLLLD